MHWLRSSSAKILKANAQFNQTQIHLIFLKFTYTQIKPIPHEHTNQQTDQFY
jgi:hypothetical protein